MPSKHTVRLLCQFVVAPDSLVQIGHDNCSVCYANINLTCRDKLLVIAKTR